MPTPWVIVGTDCDFYQMLLRKKIVNRSGFGG